MLFKWGLLLEQSQWLLSTRVRTGICPRRGLPELQGEVGGQHVGLASREGGCCGQEALPWEGGQELGRSWNRKDFRVGLGCEGQCQALGEGQQGKAGLPLWATSGGHHSGWRSSHQSP